MQIENHNSMKNYHLTPSQFRKEGKKVIDWIADYYENIEKYPVLSQVKPGEIMSKLPLSAPEKGESMDAMMKDLDEIIMRRDYPLAIALVFWLFPVQHIISFNFRRSHFFGSGNSGDDLGNKPCSNRAGNPGA